MPLAITDEHQALADVVRSFTDSSKLRRRARAALDDGGPDVTDIWAQIAAAGWLGLHVPETFGGSGYGLLEAAVVTEQLGAQIAPAPWLPSLVTSAVLVACGSDDQRRAHLPGLVDGSILAGVAILGDVRASTDGGLTGAVDGLLATSGPDLLLVRTGDDLVLLPGSHLGLSISPLGPFDPSAAYGTVELNGVSVPPGARLPGAYRIAAHTLRILVGAEAAGGSRAVLDMALDYAKLREQFGRTIGSFQAIKHQLADMLVQSEVATAAAWDAARAADAVQAGLADDDQRALASGVAALLAPPAYQANAQQNIQIHGGIGFTWEHDAHLYLRRSVVLATVATALDAGPDVYRLTDSGVQREFGVDLPPEAERYRTQAREFRVRYDSASPTARRALLADSGYLVPHWPPPWGLAAGPVQQLVIDEELAGIDHPNLGITAWVLLTLVQTATPDQVQRWVPKGLSGEEVWCQLFSEPGAGSDAAAVRTRAERVEGGWQVNGQKVWTSGAQFCRRGLATVRTDPSAAKHQGITTMVIDLYAPGVEVRPLKQITGGADFNEVFFDDVFVADEDVVGPVNGGWAVARTTLGNERVTIGGGIPGRLNARDLIALVRTYGDETESTREAIADFLAHEQALASVNLRQVARAVAGAAPGPEGSVTKLAGAEHTQRMTEFGLRIAGAAALSGTDGGLAGTYLGNRSMTIAGGTSEITRNVIAERILGLPRDPLNK